MPYISAVGSNNNAIPLLLLTLFGVQPAVPEMVMSLKVRKLRIMDIN